MDTSIELTERAFSQLNRDQQRAVMKFTRSLGGFLWWKVGTGKTRIAIFWFAMLQKLFAWPMPSICLCVVRRKTFQDWREEINRVWPEACVYEDTLPEYPPDLNPGFLLLSDAMLAKEQEKLQRCKWIRCVVLDEGWLYANHKAKKTLAASKLTLGKNRIIMTGTVMKARSPLEIWAQALAINKHRVLAPTLTKFRTKYMAARIVGPFTKEISKPGAYTQIVKSLGDMLDEHFPKGNRLIHDQYHNVEATAQQQKLFRDLREYMEISEAGIEYNHALQIGIKIQQISNGFYITDTDSVVRVATNKPAKLLEEIESILAEDETNTVVVWCAFLEDIEILRGYLPFATLQMSGSHKFDVQAWRDRKARVCLATEASGSGVNHFAQTPYAIYYSANYKWKDMQQSRGRTDRTNSLHDACFYKYLQVRGSIDAEVYRTALASGEEEAKLLQVAAVQNWMKK